MLFLVPVTRCPAQCRYCYAAGLRGGPIMRPELALDAVSWAFDLNKELHPPETLKVTFHGGEPLLAGHAFYREVLRGWDRVAKGPATFSVQSNLWLMTPELARLFNQHRVRVGTSLDGPPEITDMQRGAGYSSRTLHGMENARRNGVRLGCIATLTRKSRDHIPEILRYFAGLGLDVDINPAGPSLDDPLPDWALSPEEYRDSILEVFDAYLPRLEQIRIDNVDRMCRSLVKGEGQTCLFTDCLGRFLAVDPDGWIYPCNRFVGHEAFRLGNLRDRPGWSDLASTPVWRRMADRQRGVDVECSECSYHAVCRGGCSYNWLAAGRPESLKDPCCAGYGELFRRITDLAVEDLEKDAPPGKEPVVWELMTGACHPDGDQVPYRRIIAAGVLGKNRSMRRAARMLANLGVARTKRSALLSLRMLRDQLSKPARPNNDLYLHLTGTCALGCKHCYASSDAGSRTVIDAGEVVRICHEAAEVGFRRIVLTGGEPLLHPQLKALLRELATVRSSPERPLLVLRTSLMTPLDIPLTQLLDSAVDQVVVSVDGGEETHDARRHLGAYRKVVERLQFLMREKKDLTVRLAALLPPGPDLARGMEEVSRLAKRLGIESVRVRHPRPLGRAREWLDLDHLEYANEPVGQAIAQERYPRSSCGIGTNLHVEADLRVYPCFAFVDEAHLLGSLAGHSLREILQGKRMRRILRRNVDEIEECSRCSVRYLCGGACHAWSHAGQAAGGKDLFCNERRIYAESLLNHSLAALGISRRSFEEAMQ